MADDELIHRLRRIYAALDATEETDMSRFGLKTVVGTQWLCHYQDFTSGLSEEELENAVHSLIHNIANLHGHLRRRAGNRSRDESIINEGFNNSPALMIIVDLSNNDKHGYPSRKGGYSGKSPRIEEVTRSLRLSTGTGMNSSASVAFPLGGGPPEVRASGTGEARVVTGSTVLDRKGDIIGDVRDLALEAIKALERILDQLGIA